MVEEIRKVPATEPRVCVFNLTRQSFLSLGVEVADTQWARMRGLIGRLRLGADDGVWVVPSQGIHTIGLTFPIDLVYLDASSRVIHVVEHLGPFRVGPLKPQSRSVLELPAQSVFCSNTRIGDQFLICSPEELAAHLGSYEQRMDTGGQAMEEGGEGKPAGPAGNSNGSVAAWIRRWFRTFGDRRRARRSALPGVAAYYWEGGVPEAHSVLNLSKSGAYIATTRKWYPGTIIELTLQQHSGNGRETAQTRSFHVSTRVVRCGSDGVGVRFLYTGPTERMGVRRLLAAVKRAGRGGA